MSLNLGLGIGLPLGGGGFDPAALFTVSGSRGFMYDLSDYSSQFQDTGGTTPITATSQSVGLVLDKSQGLALGAELITNGDFSNGLTGWTDASSAPATFTVVSGQGVLASSGTTARGRQTIATVAGRTYRVEFDAVCIDATGCSLNCSGVSAGTTDIFSATVTTGRFSRLFVATSTTTYLQWGRNTSGTFTFDNISVRELAGNHATQATAGNRPLTTTIGSGYRGIQFDGTDDWLQTAAIDFSNSDEVTVVAGVRKLSDATLNATLVEIGNVNVSAVGTFTIAAPGGNAGSYGVGSRGLLNAGSSSPLNSAPAPDSAVLTGQGKISTDTGTLRRNGTQIASAVADQGTGNYANSIVYIGRRGGASLPLNGVLTFLFAINRLLTANELAAVERFANSRTGAF